MLTFVYDHVIGCPALIHFSNTTQQETNACVLESKSKSYINKISCVLPEPKKIKELHEQDLPVYYQSQ